MRSERRPRPWVPYLFIIFILHALALWGFVALGHLNPAFWGFGLLAYSFGLRHAFDVDHIAAIDNSVRKIVQQRGNATGVGFYFSLGHSTVVFMLVLALTLFASWVEGHVPQFENIGNLVGSSVSGIFLVIIGLINTWFLVSFVRRVRRADDQDAALGALMGSRGVIARLARPLFQLVGKSWHVYLIGFLFGLGFDTATEVGLLAISVTAMKGSTAPLAVLSLPVLFAAGMSLMDSLDGIFMTAAYSWALNKPHTKITYNIVITSVSAAAALAIGGFELLRVAPGQLAAVTAWMGQWLAGPNLGYELAGLLVLLWLAFLPLYRRSNHPTRR